MPYRNYLLTVLVAILAFNYVDRLALGLLLQDIKVDLSLSDTQLGLLNGIAFAIFYSLMGIPIARWADRGNRVRIISITTALWSVAVMLCGVAGGFLQLLLIRIGAAVGEAGCIPPAHSLIADYFNRAERPRAVACYKLGAPISVVIGYFLAGWLSEFYGWRATFVLLAAPGLGLSLLAWSTLKEPRTESPAPATTLNVAVAASSAPKYESAATRQPSLKETSKALWANATFCQLVCGFAVHSFFGWGIQQWQPAFFIRTHGMQTGELGTWFAVVSGLGGILGMYLGGTWASRRAVNNERLQLKAMSLAYCCFGVVSAFVYLTPSPHLAFAFLGIATVGSAAVVGPLFATVQTLVPDRMRATSIAILYLFANLVGMGLGPLAAGIMADGFRPWAGEESLRIALLAMCPGYLWVAWHFWRGSKTVTRDLARVCAEAPLTETVQKWDKVANTQ